MVPDPESPARAAQMSFSLFINCSSIPAEAMWSEPRQSMPSPPTATQRASRSVFHLTAGLYLARAIRRSSRSTSR